MLSRHNEELSSDALSLSGFEQLSAAAYHLAIQVRARVRVRVRVVRVRVRAQPNPTPNPNPNPNPNANRLRLQARPAAKEGSFETPPRVLSDPLPLTVF